jgi:cell division protein ZapA
MSGDEIPVSVLILDKEYRIACGEEERESLLQTSQFLDRKMRDIRDSGKVIGTDRIAVMAALNLAHELLTQKSISASGDQNLSQRLQLIQQKIDAALDKNS